MIEQCDVLLAFVNKNEKQAVYDACKERYKRDPVIKPGEVLTYHDFGTIAGARVWGIQTEMGSSTPGGSAVSISSALNETKARYVILVGIAFGMDREEQRIGDILVSKQLLQYETGKIGTGEDEEDREIPRGDIVTAPERILNKFETWSAKPYWQGAAVRFGLMVSGEKLIDNVKFKGKLKEKYPEAIGGDMEAAGAYAAARHYNCDWIVVKAVCDYADGKKKWNKQKNQELAAANAAKLVFHVLENGSFGSSFFTARKKEEKREKTPPLSRSDIRELVKENIIKLLNKRKMEHFRGALGNRLNIEKNGEKEYDIHRMAEILVNKDVLAAVSTLDTAVKKCFEDLSDAGADVDQVNRTWIESVNILGWLVLLGVDDEWAEETIRYLAEKGENLHLTIPVKTGAGVEIVISRLKETKADLRIDGENKKVLGKKGIPCDRWGEIEEGWDTGDKVLMIKTALWKQLIKVAPTGNKYFTPDMDDELNETILAKRDRGEHHYISVDRSCSYHPLLEKGVYDVLIKDLPALEIFFIGSDDREVTIISEPKLNARLRVFFDNKPE